MIDRVRHDLPQHPNPLPHRIHPPRSTSSRVHQHNPRSRHCTQQHSLCPGHIFPDFSAGVRDALSKADFWVCMMFLLSINVLCFMFFRKEQLQKP